MEQGISGDVQTIFRFLSPEKKEEMGFFVHDVQQQDYIAFQSEEEVIEVCKKVGLDEFILKMPNKYDTKVGEGGLLLSNGQKQYKTETGIVLNWWESSKTISIQGPNGTNKDKFEDAFYKVLNGEVVSAVTQPQASFIPSAANKKIFIVKISNMSN